MDLTRSDCSPSICSCDACVATFDEEATRASGLQGVRMKRQLVPAFFALFLLAITCPIIHAEETVKVTITITVPKETDEKATLYLAGGLKEVGEWKADGVKLTRNDDGTYKFEADLPKDQ